MKTSNLDLIVIAEDSDTRKAIKEYCQDAEGIRAAFAEKASMLPEMLSVHAKANTIFIECKNLESLRSLKLDLLSQNYSVIIYSDENNFALECYDCGVVDFIFSELSFSRFVNSLSKSKAMNTGRFFESNEQSSFKYTTGKNTNVLKHKDIDYIQASGNYATVYHNQNHSIMIYTSMDLLTRKLPNPLFQRIHRSYIVSILKVEAITSHSLKICGQWLPISKSYKEKLHQALSM